jgi:hypothetical protein
MSEALRLWRLGQQQQKSSQAEAALKSFQQSLVIFQSIKSNEFIGIVQIS